MTSSTNPSTTIPTWKYALPVVTFSIGFGYGKIVKKCWGCAFGFGFAAGAVGLIPLGLHYNKIHSIGMKSADEKASESKPAEAAATKEVEKAAPATVKSGDIVTMMQDISKSQNKEADFNSQKDKITQAVDSLNDKEKSVLMDMMALGKSMTDKKVKPADAYTAVMSKMAQLQKTYGDKFINDFSNKMKEVETKFGITLNLNK